MASPAQGNSIDLLSLRPPPAASLSPPAVISLAQLQARPPPVVSTGLRVALEDQQQYQNRNESNPLLSSSHLSPVLSNYIAPQLNQHQQEFDHFLRAQGEQLRRTLTEKRRRHCAALLCAVEEAAARTLREKEAEVDRVVRRRTELEGRVARLKAVSLAWQAKAMAYQAAAAALQAQLQQAKATAAAAAEERETECRDSPAQDAESAHVDPDRVEPERACRVCRCRPVSVVLLPCRHLCLCSACAAAPSDACPVCRCLRTGCVQVFLS